MGFKELTPKSLVDGTRGPQLIVPKKKWGRDEVDLRWLPVKVDDGLVVGAGDWGCGRSSKGSVVIRVNYGWVVKAPVGETMSDAVLEALAVTGMVERFKGVAPETLVLISEAGIGGAKPVIIQRVVEGKPVCDTSFREMFQVGVLRTWLEVISVAHKVFREAGVVDLWGLQFRNKWISRIASMTPFFSDNVMIGGGRAVLVDNAPCETQHRPVRGRWKWMTELRLGVMEGIIGLALAALILQSWLGKGEDRSGQAPKGVKIWE